MQRGPHRKGVCDLIERVRQFNPRIGEYVKHGLPDEKEMMTVNLTNGTIRMHIDAAHSQEAFPVHVPHEWITEIEGTFEESKVAASSTVPSWKKWLGLRAD